MDSSPSLLVALLLGIVEGLTEFLPISSTGHLIVAGSVLGYTGDEAKVFEIVIQAGAILAVCWEFRARLVRVARGLFRDPQANRFVANLAIAFMPAAVLGLAFGKFIKASLFAPVPVAIAFVAGAFVILWAERRQRTRPDAVRIDDVDAMGWSDALKVGCAQAFALIPGTSRSGATIIGGMLFGLSRRAATEFSFFLAIPTLFAACLYETVKNRAAAGRRRPLGVRRRLRGGVRVGVPLRALAAAVREPPRLRPVRVVPDRVRRRDPGHGVERPRALELTPP